MPASIVSSFLNSRVSAEAGSGMYLHTSGQNYGAGQQQEFVMLMIAQLLSRRKLSTPDKG